MKLCVRERKLLWLRLCFCCRRSRLLKVLFLPRDIQSCGHVLALANQMPVLLSQTYEQTNAQTGKTKYIKDSYIGYLVTLPIPFLSRHTGNFKCLHTGTSPAILQCFTISVQYCVAKVHCVLNIHKALTSFFCLSGDCPPLPLPCTGLCSQCELVKDSLLKATLSQSSC